MLDDLFDALLQSRGVGIHFGDQRVTAEADLHSSHDGNRVVFLVEAQNSRRLHSTHLDPVIHQDHVDRLLAELARRFSAIRTADGVGALLAQLGADEAPDFGVMCDDQNSGGHARWTLGSSAWVQMELNLFNLKCLTVESSAPVSSGLPSRWTHPWLFGLLMTSDYGRRPSSWGIERQVSSNGTAPGRAYGFITRESGDDLFVHFTALGTSDEIREGQRVEFDISESGKGPMAQDVRLL